MPSKHMEVEVIKEDLVISVYTTVFNNANAVEKSVNSLIRAFEGLKYEIVIIDNHSNDGTFEILAELAEKYPIRLYRYKCSRGLGRELARRLSRGKYLLYADLDTVYNWRLLRKIIEEYLKRGTKKCLAIGNTPLICPRELLEEIGGFRDLNRAEDIDVLTRLLLNNLVQFSDVRKISHNQPTRQGKKLRMLIREKRYSKGLTVVRRWIRGRIDNIIGNAITVKKIIVEFRYLLKYSIPALLISILTRIPFIIIVKVLEKEIVEGDQNLTNGTFIKLRSELSFHNLKL